MDNEESKIGDAGKNGDEKYHTKYDHYHDYHHHGFKFILLILGMLIVAGGFFALGRMTSRANNFERRPMMVNINGASGRFNNGYGRSMGMTRRGGIVGTVTAINGNNITIKTSDGTEYTIVVSDSTSFIKSGNIAKQSDVAVNNSISVFGNSNSQGQISATMIKIN